VPLLRSTSIGGFIKGTILFQWPWKCMTHSGVIWIVSSRNVPIFSTIDNQKVIYPYLFAIYFSRQRVNIALHHALASIIARKITLVGDVCSRPPITIRSHDLHAYDIRRVVGKIASYHEKD